MEEFVSRAADKIYEFFALGERGSWMPRDSADPIRMPYRFSIRALSARVPRTRAPRNERTSVHAGTFQIFTPPDQLPVASNSLFGEKRTCDIGRSSPICEPMFANLCLLQFPNVPNPHEKVHLNLIEDILANVQNPRQWHSRVYTLLRNSLLSSISRTIHKLKISTS